MSNSRVSRRDKNAQKMDCKVRDFAGSSTDGNAGQERNVADGVVKVVVPDDQVKNFMDTLRVFFGGRLLLRRLLRHKKTKAARKSL